jgi:DNA-binding transcriptional ArsR family regulator
MDSKKLAKIMKALSNPNRLEIYLEIVKRYKANFDSNKHEECFIYDIMSRFKIGAPTISHHLKELANANLITTERQGKFLVAKINEETVNEVKKVLTIKLK